MKKGRAKKSKKKQNLDDMENLSFTEAIAEAEELCSREAEKDSFSDGDFDDKNVISRVKLF